jgi:hypothetical protein
LFFPAGLVALVSAVIGHNLAAHIPPVPAEKALKWGERLAILKLVRVLALANVLVNTLTMAVRCACACRCACDMLTILS